MYNNAVSLLTVQYFVQYIILKIKFIVVFCHLKPAVDSVVLVPWLQFLHTTKVITIY